MSKVMTLALLMLLVETLPTMVLFEEVKTLPTTYSPTHVHLTLPSTRRSMQGVFNVVNEGADKIGETAKNVGEIANQGQDVVDAAGKISHAISSYIPSSYIIIVILVYVLYA